MKKVTYALTFAIISVPFFASAMTTLDVEQQLGVYRGVAPSVLGASTVSGTMDTTAKVDLKPDQVQILLKGLKYTDKQASSAIIKTTLKSGSTDTTGGTEEVKKLQLFLNAEGSTIPATGKFGAMTKAAVMAYQKKKGMKADGVVGPKVRAAIAADIDAAVAAKTTTN